MGAVDTVVTKNTNEECSVDQENDSSRDTHAVMEHQGLACFCASINGMR